uniref:Uncharacterized protein n=1 Tax=Siphoviridae sp. ctxMM9 TaxID=2827973 RepID=A0A8S5T6L2_9CAUD|nr:MAG TPA: hypothetical protein [Siphoviridae sp. ctxMM9]
MKRFLFSNNYIHQQLGILTNMLFQNYQYSKIFDNPLYIYDYQNS